MLQIAAVLVCFFGLTLTQHTEFGRERTYLGDDYDKWTTSSPPITEGSHFQPIKSIDESRKVKSNNDYIKRITWSPPNTGRSNFQLPIKQVDVSIKVPPVSTEVPPVSPALPKPPPVSTKVPPVSPALPKIPRSSPEVPPVSPELPKLPLVSAEVPPVSTIVPPVSAKVKRYFLLHLRMNWYKAIRECSLMGLQLATINDLEEYNELVKQIKTEGGDNSFLAGYWTAGSDLEERGKYIWLTTGKPLTFTKWNRGEPSHGKVNEDVERCVELRAVYDYRMNDNFCSQEKYVICETKL